MPRHRAGLNYLENKKVPEWFDEPGEILAVLSIVAAVFAGLIWIIKAVDAIKHETKPNSGQSLRDAVDRIESSVTRLNDKLDNHIDWHLDNKEK